MESKNFYIYEWYNIDTNVVFYVGKGMNNRYKVLHGRNQYFLNYYNKYNCDVRKVFIGLTEQEAFQKEQELIEMYQKQGECFCNLTKGGEGISGYKHNENAKKKISETHKGSNNSQFGVSLKERLGDKYDDFIKQRSLSNKGKHNPNYNNHTLHDKYKRDKQLSKEKQGRPKEQNGHAVMIDLYDESWNFIQRFSYIGACADFLHKNYNFSANAEVVRCGIRRSIKYNVPYKGFRFIKIQ